MDIADPRINPALVPAGSRAIVIAEHQAEYQSPPCVRTPHGYVITRWSPTDEERAAIVAGADIFVTLLSAGPINPFFVTVGRWTGRRIRCDAEEDAEKAQRHADKAEARSVQAWPLFSLRA